jgi:hypothetical protein
MFPLTRRSMAAADALVALTAANIPARADELAQNLRPVGPREPSRYAPSAGGLG